MNKILLLILTILFIEGTPAVQASPTPHRVRRVQLVSTPKPTPTPTPLSMPTATIAEATPVATVGETSNGKGPNGIGSLLVLAFIVGGIWLGVKWLFNRPPPPPSPAELEVQRQILEDLRSGIAPERVSAPGYFCKSGEKVLYAFNNVKYYRLKGHAHYVGGSHGVSVRTMKGVSYRVGAHRGHREVTQTMDFQGIGTLVVTNQAINFIGHILPGTF